MTVEEEIKSKAELIAKAIQSGKSIEIHPCKDGIKILEVKKKIVNV